MLVIIFSPAFGCSCRNTDDSDWQNNLRQWLQLSYIEDEQWAAFGFSGSNYLASDLHTTYAAVGIMECAKQPIEDKTAIIHWINSLQTEAGSYYSSDTIPVLFQTYWAVATLTRLGGIPSSADAIIEFLGTQQQLNKSFYYTDFDDESIEDSIEAYLSPTYLAIEILSLTGQWSDDVIEHFSLLSIVPDLLAYTELHLSDGGPSLTEKEAGYVSTAISIIARIQPDALSSHERTWIDTRLSEISGLPIGVQSVLAANSILDVAENTGIDYTSELDNIKEHISAEFIPELLSKDQITSNQPDAINPMMIYDSVRLVLRTGTDYPYLELLLDKLAVHRVQNGWCPYISFPPSIQATFYALTLIEHLQMYEPFDHRKIASYLAFTIEQIEQTEANYNAEDMYSAIRACKVFGDDLPEFIRENLVTWVENQFTKLSSADPEGESTDILNMLLIANEIEIRPDDSILPYLETKITNLLERINNLDIDSMYELYCLDTFNGTDHKDTIESAVLELQTDSGVFKSHPSTLAADIHSTYRAAWLLQSIGDTEQIDAEAVIDFVNDCRAVYGFDNTPSEMQDENDMNAPIQLSTVYEALWLLDNYDN